jgi:diguanylate cyclase (GGDEF)-like protein/PAS domain S-box-containing protein
MLPQPSSRGPSRWRLVAACGAATAAAGLLSLVLARPSLVSLWLVCAGIGVAVLSVQAMRKERAAGALRQQRDEAERARAAAEALSLQLADTSPDLLTLHGPDGRFTHVSSASRQVLGYDPEELIGRHPDELVFAEDVPIVLAVRNRAREADDVGATIRLVRRDGRPVWIEARLSVDRANRTTRVIARDVHERVEAERALAEAEARFRTAFDEGAVGMAIVDPDGRLLRVNRALASITGHAEQELQGRPLTQLLLPEERTRHAEEAERMLRGDVPSFRGEARYLHADGHVVWVSVSTTLVRDPSHRPLHFLVQAQDVTERRRHEAELRRMADHDALTGLLNRRAFERELERHVAHVGRYGPQGAVVLLDIDRFKNVNDTLGHSAGDQLIAKVADALRERIGNAAALARLGGDEFAVLLPDGTREDAHAIAEDVLCAIRRIRIASPSGRLRMVGASIGIAPFDSEGLTGEDVLVAADLAMYEAKEGGRNRVASHGAGQDAPTKLATRLSWTDVIRDALDEERLVLQAQPIMSLDSGEIGQYEMLLRMRDPLGELISPAAFLPVAERYDLIGAIDRWVVRTAIEMLGAELKRGRKLTFEVNISGRSTGDEELLELIEQSLGANGVDPSQVIFEVTETTAVADIPRAQEFAGRLAALGCRFALDDFGAAFASFYYLKHLPFDYLKIDGEFVRSCANNKTDQLVIQAVVDIAKGLGKTTVAEMVSDQETIDLLRGMGVDKAQGFAIGRPAPLARWLVDTRPQLVHNLDTRATSVRASAVGHPRHHAFDRRGLRG